MRMFVETDKREFTSSSRTLRTSVKVKREGFVVFGADDYLIGWWRRMPVTHAAWAMVAALVLGDAIEGTKHERQ